MDNSQIDRPLKPTCKLSRRQMMLEGHGNVSEAGSL